MTDVPTRGQKHQSETEAESFFFHDFLHVHHIAAAAAAAAARSRFIHYSVLGIGLRFSDP